MNHLAEVIKQKASDYLDETVRIRRHFHKNPELSFRENNTLAFIKDYLLEHDISFIDNIVGTGLIARVKGNKGSGPMVALRAELDALPIKESTNSEYSSIVDGVMHACGHDAHLAMLLSSLMIINDLKDQFRGEVIFIFQPGEELAPGGAKLILEEGTLRKLNPAAIIAQHVLPELETGRIGCREGVYMASSDEIYIDILGKGGHAALPGQSSDQILIGSRLVCRLKEKIEALEASVPKVIGIGAFIAPGATNVIPDRVHIEGTLRTFDEKIRNRMHLLVKDVCQQIESEYGVKIELEIRKGYPVLTNDTYLSSRGSKAASCLWGSENVVPLELRMSSEDFAFYIPGISCIFLSPGC
ncbi:MAG TPA: M20 family metallopeptidase [Bacteroidales bacterium]|nr:M20 family metallopeptidase [Bacteroidales bacterium]